MTATCALCGFRAASTITDWDGRPVPACSQCVGEISQCVDEIAPAVNASSLSMTGRVALLVRQTGSSGLDLNSICLSLDAGDATTRNAVSKALSRLVADGYLDASGSHNERFYRPGPRPLARKRWHRSSERRTT